MKLKSIRLFNFVTHKDTNVDFSKQGSYCIYSSDNGVGKSLILDAIVWGPWGKTIRGGSADTIVGPFAAYTMVEQIWWDGKRSIKIVRYRKHSKYKNRVLIFFSDGVDWKEDSSKETRKDTDKYICSLFKMDYDLCISSVLITKPRSELNFCESKDTKRKEVLTNLLNLNWIASSLDRAKEHKSKLEKELEVERRLRDSETSNLINTDVNLKDLKRHSEEFKIDIEWQLENLKKFEKKKLNIVSLKDMKKFKENLDNKEKSLIAFEKIHDNIRKQLYEEEALENSYDDTIGAINNKLKTIHKKLKDVDKNEYSDICDHCGAKYNSSNVKNLKNKILLLKKVTLQEKESYQFKKDKVGRSIVLLTAQVVESRLRISKYEENVNTLKKRFIHLKRDREQYKEDLEERNSKEKLILETKNKKNPFLKKIRLAKKKLKLFKQERAKITSKIILLKKKIKDTEYAIEAFGNSGIKNDIISTKIELLEEKINYYLSKISHGNIYVQLDNKVQHGQNERIGIMIQDNKKTKPLDYNEWSGGEKTKIRFAVEWAINSILESNIDLLIVDEGFDFLSEVGIAAIMDVMKQETSKKIISVSNVPEMKGMFKNKILVELKDDISCVRQFG